MFSEFPITLAIVGTNVIISLAAFSVPSIMEVGMLQPYRTVKHNTWYELITSGFLHGSIGHLAFNMLTLFFFGSVMEQTLGGTQFIALYFTGLIVSSIPSIIRHRDNPEYATIGASGAVESVLFAFTLLYPFENIYLMFIPIGIPAIIFGVMFVAYSIWASKREGKVNHEAHLAGAAWGILYLLIFVPGIVPYLLTNFGLN